MVSDNVALRAEDLLPVRSRISWGPIFAGAAVALASYFLLTLLGAAVGFSVSDRVTGDSLGTGAAVWAVLVTGLSLFVGGYIASQLSVGESKSEAVVYGLVVWGAVFVMLLWLMASGVRAGFNAMVGMANVTANAAEGTTQGDWEALARRAGVPQERIEEFRRSAQNAPEDARRAANDPQNRQAAAETATRATWWAFAGTLASMLAAVAGAVVGSGPNFRLIAVPTGRAIGVGSTVTGTVSGVESRETFARP